MTHTPEPWVIGTPPPNGEQTIGTKNGLMVAVSTTGHNVNSKANASRIVACVNACAGSTDEELKQVADAGGFALLIARWNLEASAHADNADTFADEIERLTAREIELTHVCNDNFVIANKQSVLIDQLKQQNAALSEQVAGLVGAIDIWQENPTTGNGFALIDAAAIAKAGSHE